MDGNALRSLSKKFAGKFVRQHPSIIHLRDELEQEAALAIFTAAPRYRPGTLSLESFCYLPALNAMQQHCAQLGRVVGHARNDRNRDFITNTNAGAAPLDQLSYDAPQEQAVMQTQASRELDSLIGARMNRLGKFKAAPKALQQAFKDVVMGISKAEAAANTGLTRQRFQQLADNAGLGDLC